MYVIYIYIYIYIWENDRLILDSTGAERKKSQCTHLGSGNNGRSNLGACGGVPKLSKWQPEAPTRTPRAAIMAHPHSIPATSQPIEGALPPPRNNIWFAIHWEASVHKLFRSHRVFPHVCVTNVCNICTYIYIYIYIYIWGCPKQRGRTTIEKNKNKQITQRIWAEVRHAIAMRIQTGAWTQRTNTESMLRSTSRI